MSKTKSKKLSVPREMPEIQSAYQQLCANLGQVEYQLYVHGQEKQRIQEQLKSVNNEAAARQQLDAQKPKEEAKQPLEQSQAV